MRLKLISFLALLVTISLPTSTEARPRAAHGEPEFTREGTDDLGREVYLQRFQVGERRLDSVDFSIARGFLALGGDGRSFQETTIRLRCDIRSDGEIDSWNCDPIGALTETQKTMREAVGWGRIFRMLPPFRKLTDWFGDGGIFGKAWVHRRQVEFDLVLPAMEAPIVDLSSGPLVERTEVTTNQNEAFGSYPPRALREEWQAQIEAECQVQSDLSVICQEENFEAFGVRTNDDPEVARRVFRRHFERGMGRLQAEPNLEDGSDARGVRYKLVLSYVIDEANRR